MKCILIVDDSIIVRRTLRALLERQIDWIVCGEAENGQEGIAKAQQLHPDLILLDFSMPVMNGLQAARKLKILLPSTPIVMFTNHASHTLDSDAHAAGIDSVRDKGEGIATLVKSIQELLA